jgi:hypothetical protein
MGIRVTGERTVRETTAPYIYKDEKGKEQSSDIAVQYYSSTTGYMKQQWAEAKQKQAKAKTKAAKDADDLEMSWYTDELVKVLFALPDLEAADGGTFEITVENLDNLDIRNVKAIRQAIADDIDAKKSQPSA